VRRDALPDQRTTSAAAEAFACPRFDRLQGRRDQQSVRRDVRAAERVRGAWEVAAEARRLDAVGDRIAHEPEYMLQRVARRRERLRAALPPSRNGWFAGMHCYAKYVKVARLHGARLSSPPPVASKDKNARYFHIHEGDVLDEAQLRKWVKQASKLPGWGKA
jgi:hypothetical protein